MTPAHRADRKPAATSAALSSDEAANPNGLATRIGVQGNRYDDAGMARVGL